MKTFLTVLVLLLPFCLSICAQEIILEDNTKEDRYTEIKYKKYDDETGTYTIKYYLGLPAFTPLTIGGQTHYHCGIEVYSHKLLNYNDSTLICNKFKGIYVEKNCHEDIPHEQVNRAKYLKLHEMNDLINIRNNDR